MHERLLEVLVCPQCEVSLSVAAGRFDSRGVLNEGRLHCPACDRSYPVTRGVPRLRPPAAGTDPGAGQTIAHFEMEFTAPDLIHDDADLSRSGELGYVFFSRTGIDPDVYDPVPEGLPGSDRSSAGSTYRPDSSFLLGKRVLDGGCGPGRFLPLVAEAADHVVGLEYGDHVLRAAQRCQSLDNVDLVQGSVLQPPFAAGSFDYAFTVGVLHHTADPKLGCLQLAGLVRPGGAMSVWVYSPEYWGDPVRSVVNRTLHARLSRLEPSRALEICTRWLYPLGRLQMTLARRRWTKLAAAPLFLLGIPRHDEREVMISTIYDRFGPSIITTHDYPEVENWLREAGFAGLRRLPIPTAVFAEKLPIVEQTGAGLSRDGAESRSRDHG